MRENWWLRFPKAIISLIIISMTALGCVSTGLDVEPVTSLSLRASALVREDGDLNYYLGLQNRLRQLIHKDEVLEAISLDIKLYIESRIAFLQGDVGVAESKAFAALRTNKDDLSEEFFEWWLSIAIKTNFKSLPKPDALAAYILAKTENGKQAIFLREEHLTSKNKLEDWIVAEHPNYVEYLPQGTPTEMIAPASAKLPLLTDLPEFLNRFCEVRKSPSEGWNNWQKSLSLDQRLFLNAASLRVCDSEREGGKELEALSREFLKRNNLPLYFLTLTELISHYRAIGNRDALSDAYLEQTKLWEKEVIKEDNSGLQGLSLEFRKINDFLWAARYRALTGDYENSKVFGQKAAKFVINTFARYQVPDASKKGRELKELQVEAQHIMAFRVAIEKQDFEGARALYELALRTSGIDSKWRMILVWHLGLVCFVHGDYEKSLEIWKEILLAKNGDAESYRDSALFWSARAHLKLGNKISATHYTLELIEKFPFSFYTINGISSTELLTLIEGSSLTRLLSPDFRRFDNTQVMDLHKWREDGSVGNFLIRAEILSHLGDRRLGQRGVKYLARKVSGHKLAQQSQALLVYITRLQTIVGLNDEAIRLTQKISEGDSEFWQKWPEQVFIMYPTPYKEIYTRHALATGIDWTLLLAVSRQESLFRASARSPAGAVGLMQLMPETGRIVAQSRSVEIGDINATLSFPETNINLGSLYLQNLSVEFHEFVPAILSAYNSGAYTTQTWLKRRYQEDPLLWVELIPFAETREYVKKVWRNQIVYKNLYPVISEE